MRVTTPIPVLLLLIDVIVDEDEDGNENRRSINNNVFFLKIFSDNINKNIFLFVVDERKKHLLSGEHNRGGKCTFLLYFGIQIQKKEKV